jgi:voltage-gated potassium channel
VGVDHVVHPFRPGWRRPAPAAHPARVTNWRRLSLALSTLAGIIVVGTLGYVVLGFSVLDALYQTVTTVATVGFREVEPLDTAGKIFTIVLILVGVGTALYTFTVLLETLIEGHLAELFGRRRMERQIDALRDHVIVCGWGRVGRAIGDELLAAGTSLVAIEADDGRAASSLVPIVLGDATDDAILEKAGLHRARAVIAALDTDAANLFLTVTARALHPEVFIVARARVHDSEAKLRRAGADRVVNPQSIGGARIAAFVLQPHVTEFLDIVMHDRNLEFRLAEVVVPPRSTVAGRSIREAQLRDQTGALVLALREQDGTFHTNPSPDTPLREGHVLIAIGTADELVALHELVTDRG